MTAKDFDPKLQGLSQAEARQRLAEHGPNALPEAKAISLWQRMLSQFKSALIYILLFALALDLALWLHEGAKQVPYESIAIGLILILNAGLGAYQESKAEEALARLKALAVPSLWVKRDGVLVQIPANELVPGDIARIEAGDRVPADGRLVEGQGVMNKAPRPPSSRLLDAASLRFIVISGMAKAVGGIAFLGAMPQLGFSLEETRTSVFLYESMM